MIFAEEERKQKWFNKTSHVRTGALEVEFPETLKRKKAGTNSRPVATDDENVHEELRSICVFSTVRHRQ